MDLGVVPIHYQQMYLSLLFLSIITIVIIVIVIVIIVIVTIIITVVVVIIIVIIVVVIIITIIVIVVVVIIIVIIVVVTSTKLLSVFKGALTVPRAVLFYGFCSILRQFHLEIIGSRCIPGMFFHRQLVFFPRKQN